jgi:hypothetical protein
MAGGNGCVDPLTKKQKNHIRRFDVIFLIEYLKGMHKKDFLA